MSHKKITLTVKDSNNKLVSSPENLTYQGDPWRDAVVVGFTRPNGRQDYDVLDRGNRSLDGLLVHSKTSVFYGWVSANALRAGYRQASNFGTIVYQEPFGYIVRRNFRRETEHFVSVDAARMYLLTGHIS